MVQVSKLNPIANLYRNEKRMNVTEEGGIVYYPRGGTAQMIVGRKAKTRYQMCSVTSGSHASA